jgi:hypothetical protein
LDINAQIEKNHEAKYTRSPEDSDDEPEQTDNRPQASYTLMFKKDNRQNSELEDFELKKMVGKGTFGKVYLV